MINPLPLTENSVVVDRDCESTTVAVTDNLWSEIDEKSGDFSGRSLISCFAFDSDWPTWEIHPGKERSTQNSPSVTRTEHVG